MTEFSATMKRCTQCGSESPVAAKFCPECGERFIAALTNPGSGIPVGSTNGSGEGSLSGLDPRAAFEAFVASIQADEAASKLTSLIGMNRAHLKSQGVPLPKATNPILVSLMDSLKALPSTEVSARIAIVTALGRMADPAVLPPLLLVTGAQSKDVRRATAIALGTIRHPLSAYLLLPMLLDGSSRVKQAAFQALIQMNQPHTMESILAACSCSKSLRSLVVETLRRVSDIKRSAFFDRLAESSSNQHLNLKVVADWLRFEFRNVIANSRPPFQQQNGNASSTATPKLQPPKSQPTWNNATPERLAGNSASQSQESSIFEWTKTDQLKSAAGTPAAEQFSEPNRYELSPDFAQDDDYESDVRLDGDSNSSATDLEFFNSITVSLDDSNADQDLIGEIDFASNGSQALMSLSGMLAAPEIPQQRHAQSGRPPVQSSASQNHPATTYNNAMQPSWSAPRNPISDGEFDTAAMMGNTPAHSMPGMPFMHPGGMPANTMYTPVMHPGMMPGMQAFDMTASSPLISAFTNTTTRPGAAAIDRSSSETLSVATAIRQPPTPNVVANIALPTNDEPKVDEIAAAKARAVAAHEKALARLSAARAVAIRALLPDAEEIPSKLPRLLTKRIATLMSTSAKKMDLIIKQILDLGATNSPAALSTLASFSQKPAKVIRQACAEAMGSIAHSGSAVLLLKMLADKSGTVVEAAIKSLAKLDLEPTRPVLLAAGLCGNSLRTVVTVVVESASDDKKPEWEKLLLEALQGNDEELTAFATALLARIAGETHLEIFQKLASHKASVLRAAAVEALARTQAKRAISQINNALEDDDAIVRAQAALAVATMHSPRSIELLQKLVFDNNLIVRRNAAQSMSRIEEPALAEVICSALNQETDGTSVEYLLAALQRNGAESSLPVLQRYIEGEGSQFREQAVKALRKLKIPASVPVFRRLLDDHAPALRRHGIEQLTVLKCEGIIPTFREMLKKDPDETVRSACAKSLGDYGDETSLHLLEEALEDHPLVRLQAVISLGRMGETSAGPTLLTMLQDQLPEIRYQAVRALGQLKLDGCEDSIVPLLQDSDQMVRRGAEQTLQDLGMTVSQIRRRRAKKRFVSLASRFAPSVIAGAIPGGTTSLAATLFAVIGIFVVVGSIKLKSAVAQEDFNLGVVGDVALSGDGSIVAVLRRTAVLDLWSVKEGTLNNRASVPRGTSKVFMEKAGGVIIVTSDGLRKLEQDHLRDVDSSASLKFNSQPACFSFDRESNALFAFLRDGEKTSIKKVDCATFKETNEYSIAAMCTTCCVVSPDESLAIMVDPDGGITLCQLKTGETMKGSLAQFTGGPVGIVSSIVFSSDMKLLALCASGPGLAVFAIDTMELVKNVPASISFRPTLAAFKRGCHDISVVSEDGSVLMLTNEFGSTVQTNIEGTPACQIAAISGDGKLAAFANSDEKNVWVVDADKKSLLHELKADDN